MDSFNSKDIMIEMENSICAYLVRYETLWQTSVKKNMRLSRETTTLYWLVTIIKIRHKKFV